MRVLIILTIALLPTKSIMSKYLLLVILLFSFITAAEAYERKSGYFKKNTSSHVKRKSVGRYYTPASSESSDCHTGPRGGRYQIVNGKKRYGC